MQTHNYITFVSLEDGTKRTAKEESRERSCVVPSYTQTQRQSSNNPGELKPQCCKNVVGYCNSSGISTPNSKTRTERLPQDRYSSLPQIITQIVKQASDNKTNTSFLFINADPAETVPFAKQGPNPEAVQSLVARQNI